MKRFFFRHPVFQSLRSRLIFSVTIVCIVSVTLIVSVSYRAIHSIEQNKLKTSMISDIQKLTEQMSSDYLSIVQVTQQLSPQGIVGGLVGSYLMAPNSYRAYQLGNQIEENLVIVTFANDNIGMLTYYSPEQHRTYFSQYTPGREFNPGRLAVLRENGDISYNALHLPYNKVQADPVISVVRSVSFPSSDSTDSMLIYIEAQTNTLDFVKAQSDTQHIGYSFLQLDANGYVRYSNTPDFPCGSLFSPENEDRDGFGTAGAYVSVLKRSSLGYANVLLLPVSDYNREINDWKHGVAVILLFAAAAMAVSFLSLRHMIYNPLQRFGDEMERLGGGDLSAVEYHSGVVEFDRLFGRFDVMKEQVQELLAEVRKTEREKHRLEIEKIYYQINPHFLMNTLNSVYWMAKCEGQTEIQSFIFELNSILGYSLEKTGRETTIRTELGVLQSYLNLQKKRYRFETSISVEEGPYLDSPTARLIFQPLAENAIQHGLEEPGLLKIRIFYQRACRKAVVILEDNGRGVTPEEFCSMRRPLQDGPPGNGRGIGLRYVRSMLESFYNGEAVLSITSRPHAGTRVTLLLPAGPERGRDARFTEC